jgi:short-subunit dehydrogenase
VVVTGASRGIGRAVSRAVAARGANVGLIARTQADLEQVRDELKGKGGHHTVATADVGDRQQTADALASVERDLGTIDVLVANAGIGAYGAFAEIDPDEIDRLVRVNVLGTMYPLRTVLPGMIERKRGQIVVISSIAGRIGAPYEALYSATKFAQVGLVEALVTEVERYGIGVSLVDPGPVDTDFFATRGHAYDGGFPKAVTAEKVAAAVVRAIERGTPEQFVPRWLHQALVLRHTVPPLLRWGTRRRFKSTV